ncbi:MAG: hypothetical protein V3574_04460 [Candidatus Moraniibacteriota bacterium]
MEKSPSKKIIDKIKKDKIVPESKLVLNWKSYAFWVVWIFTLFLGAIFSSFVILNILDIHPMVLRHLKLGKLFFIFFKTAPYFWIILALLAVGGGLLAIRKTKRGYRYSLIFIIGGGILTVAFLGIFLHFTKVNRHIGNHYIPRGPFPEEFIFPEKKRWCSPAEGMLGGEVVAIEGDNFNLRGFEDDFWRVYYSNETKIRVKKIETGMLIEVFGKKINQNQFRAFLIQPFPFERIRPVR